MLTINWAKIDRFYIVLIFLSVVLAAMVIFVFRSVFSAINLTYDIDQGSAVSVNTIDEKKISEAYEWVYGE